MERAATVCERLAVRTERNTVQSMVLAGVGLYMLLGSCFHNSAFDVDSKTLSFSVLSFCAQHDVERSVVSSCGMVDGNVIERVD